MIGFGGVAFIAGEAFSKTVTIKVGGSCLANGKTTKVVIEKINQVREQGLIPVIVVSALKGMTDSLLEFAINVHSDKDPKAIDRVISEGEQLSTRVLHLALEHAGIKSKTILLSDPEFPVITDDHHGNANVLSEETEERIRDVVIPLIRKKVIPIIPGFVGKTRQGEITTMGRGGSDTSAIVVGKALKTREVILLKDVPGILTGDSKLLSSTKKLAKITVDELLNLGTKGGEVLCPISLMYKPKDVKVRVVNFDNGNILESGTEIVGELTEKVKVEIGKVEQAAITVVGNKMSEIPGLLSKFSTALSKKGVNIRSVSSSRYVVCLYVDMKQQEKALEALHEIVVKNKGLTAVTSMPNISLVTITGVPNSALTTRASKYLGVRPGALGIIGTALANEGVNIVDVGSSVWEIDLLVNSKDAEKAKQILEGLV